MLKINHMVSARLPNAEGEFDLALYMSNRDDKEHLALIHGDVSEQHDVLARVHSECFTGDVLGSHRCDCGEQLQKSMRLIAEAGCGVMIYLRQEGRGIGLLNKLRAYNLQDQGYDTIEANLALGHQADEREYDIAALILNDLKIKSVRLITNNPHKIESLAALNIAITKRVELHTTIYPENLAYLRTKAERMNHLLMAGLVS